MPRDVKVQLGDGSWVQYDQVPDDQPLEAVRARAQSEYKQPAVTTEAGSRGFLGEAKELGKDFLRGGLSMLSSTAEGLASANNADRGTLKNGMLTPTEDPGQQMTADVRKMLPTPANDSPGRQLTRSVLEGMGGAVPTGGLGPMNLLSGGLAGLGGEIGANVGGDNTLARAGGAMLGGLAGGGIRAGRDALLGNARNAPSLAKAALQDIDPTHLQQAGQNLQWAKDQGHPITASQAMPVGSNLDDLVNFLAQSQHGEPVIKTLRAQPGKLAVTGRALEANLPGKVTSPQDIANRAQEASTDALQAVRKRAGEAYRDAIPPGTQVPTPLIQAFSDKLEAYAAAHPNTAAAEMADRVRGKLAIEGTPAPAATPVGSGPVSSRLQVKGGPAVPPKYITDPSQLKSAVEDAIQNYGSNALNTAAASKDLNRYAEDIRGMWKGTVRAGTPGLDAAAKASRQIFQDEYNPMKKSITGRVAGVSGASDTREAVDKLTSAFSRGTPVSGKSEILTIEKDLRKVDPTVFVDAVKTNISDRLAKAMGSPNERVPDNLAQRIQASLSANPNQARGLNDMLAGVARSRGVAESTYVNGFQNFMKLSGMMAERPQAISGLSPLDISREAGKSVGASVLQTGFFNAGYQTSKKIREALAADTFKTISRLLDTPEGLETLKQLSKKSVMSPQAKNAVAAFYGFEGSNSGTNSQQ